MRVTQRHVAAPVRAWRAALPFFSLLEFVYQRCADAIRTAQEYEGCGTIIRQVSHNTGIILYLY